MTTKHTPAPWSLSKHHSKSNIEGAKSRHIASTAGYSDNLSTWHYSGSNYHEENEANAEHILKCVNLHDELVAGLMDAHPYIADDKLRASIGDLIVKARGEV